MTISELSRENEKNEKQERKLSFLEIYASTVVVWIFFMEGKVFFWRFFLFISGKHCVISKSRMNANSDIFLFPYLRIRNSYFF